ncbi:hypothetical protein T03_7976 [Trichinella britovi]|uniref:Uncharacterized protein n=1 Tax=Trichinella britovi TaxID=45882 RepID=A0A0V1CC41_TRIBR|nr:hypothetical protein T03_7976 [Trichinella britovi]
MSFMRLRMKLPNLVKELWNADALWLREIQVKEFGVKLNTAERVKEFVPFLDQDGFLRMCGQLRRSTLPPEFQSSNIQSCNTISWC